MTTSPWTKWVPGVLCKAQMKALWKQGLIIGENEPKWDGSSFNLTLSSTAYEMLQGSVKPQGQLPYEHLIRSNDLANPLARSPDEEFLLRAKKTYVFKLREKLGRRLKDAGFHGQATAKSSVGRVDVLARLIVDGMDTYEGFSPTGLGKANGDLYLEITPITFDVKVKEGISLSQLRLFYGQPDHSIIRGEELYGTVLHGPSESDGCLRVDLTNTQVGTLRVACYFAKPSEQLDPLPLWEKTEEEKPQPWRYWRFLSTTRDEPRIKIQQRLFYLIRSKEKISVPPGIAIYCRASDETIGEMRIHYAGFVHPRFGWERGTGGTPLMFEVRGHDVDVSLADGETMAELIFYRMSETDGPPKKQRGPYEDQNLKLSKYFADWPDKLISSNNGVVEPDEG